jgi:hypothetical protein
MVVRIEKGMWCALGIKSECVYIIRSLLLNEHE